MKKQAYNPYLPSWEYIPDGEPHVFGDRVYVYGSHDRFNGYAFCLNDYVCYSAPVDSLADWRYEGVIYEKSDDPKNKDKEMCLYAPDVTCGADGRYYLYYVLDRLPVVSVAVCDTPAGKYEFYGYVHYPDGTLLGEAQGDEAQFDPAVIFENGKVYMYTGFCPARDVTRRGAMATVLEADMLTVSEGPYTIVPSKSCSEGSGYEGHEFFEASSIRKVNNKWYFVYSSLKGYELCYAVSDSPTVGFEYKGVLVTNNDIGISTDKQENVPTYFGGNNHGGMEKINGEWYIFYHRHTHGTSYSRQGCAEKIKIEDDGSIKQVEMTSCGLNGAPLKGEGEYPAHMACRLFASKPRAYTGDMGKWLPPEFPRITQEGADGGECPAYIDNFNDGTVAGYKYFEFIDMNEVSIKTRGHGSGVFEVYSDAQVVTQSDASGAEYLKPSGKPVGVIPVKSSNEWHTWSAKMCIPDGVHAVYFRFAGSGVVSLSSFCFKRGGGL